MKAPQYSTYRLKESLVIYHLSFVICYLRLEAEGPKNDK